MESPLAETRRNGRRAQPAAIRLAHWITIPLLVIKAGSGLEIFAWYPSFRPLNAQYGWYPFRNDAPPKWLRIGGWVGGARQRHFEFAWFLVLNGAIYLAYIGSWPLQTRGGCCSLIPVLALRTLSARRNSENGSPHAPTVVHVSFAPAAIIR